MKNQVTPEMLKNLVLETLDQKTLFCEGYKSLRICRVKQSFVQCPIVSWFEAHSETF